MNKNLEIKFERRFLLADLPAPLTRASEHLQFFDNYLTNTRLLLRRVRTPQTKEWQRFFIQKYQSAPPDSARVAVSEIELNEAEYEVLAVFEANELRYNRYFFALETGEKIAVDMFLNRKLWNLITATIEFTNENEIKNFLAPDFFLREITHEELFSPLRLINADLEEIRRAIDF